jgi:hypothetical protein
MSLSEDVSKVLIESVTKSTGYRAHSTLLKSSSNIPLVLTPGSAATSHVRSISPGSSVVAFLKIIYGI